MWKVSVKHFLHGIFQQFSTWNKVPWKRKEIDRKKYRNGIEVLRTTKIRKQCSKLSSRKNNSNPMSFHCLIYFFSEKKTQANRRKSLNQQFSSETFFASWPNSPIVKMLLQQSVFFSGIRKKKRNWERKRMI